MNPTTKAPAHSCAIFQGFSRPAPRAWGEVDGFTLIELLVVVVIVAVLLALLTPGLDKALEQAELTVCAARQNQLVKIFNGWAVENKRKFPAGTRDADTYEHTPWVSTQFVRMVESFAGNNKTFRAAPWGIVPVMLIDSSYKDFGYHNETGWVIGYNYLGGHPALDKANNGLGATTRVWHSPLSLANQGTGEIISCWNAWSNGTTGFNRSIAVSLLQWSIAPHTVNGPLGSDANAGAYFNYTGPGVGGDTKPLGSMGANIGFADGSVAWRTIDQTEVYVDAADAAGNPDASYMARW